MSFVLEKNSILDYEYNGLFCKLYVDRLELFEIFVRDIDSRDWNFFALDLFRLFIFVRIRHKILSLEF